MESHNAIELSELRRALERSTLELALEKVSRRTESLFEQENARQLRVENLLIEDEKDALRQELADKDDRLNKMENVTEELNTQLVNISLSLQVAQGDQRAKAREVDNLKAEIAALNGVSVDSTKLLTEKLALARELSNLKPELESLRSQTEAYQMILSDKLSLQRQLGTTQLELETERRATQRALATQGKNIEKDTRLEQQIEELRKELAQERRDKQRAERDAQKEMASWEGKKVVLEGKLDAFRNKLRTTKEQLKQVEAERHRASVSTATVASRASVSGDQQKLVRNPRKRSAMHLDMDATIGTPGLQPPAKRGKRGSTLPGDKSTFSITPFLNRTASVAPDTPGDEDGFQYTSKQKEDRPPRIQTLDDAPHTRQSTPPDPEPESKSNVAKTGAAARLTTEVHTLRSTRVGRINTKASMSRKHSMKPSLENVAEEQQDENEPPIELRAVNNEAGHMETITELSVPSIGEDLEQKKKKRKLLGNGLGKTLFDDDDGEHVKAVSRAPLGLAKGFGPLSKGGLAGSKGSTRLGPAAGAAAFGSFSPLKKDKKASTEN